MRLPILIVCVALAGCSKAPEAVEAPEMITADSPRSESAAARGISVSAAPGVAFAYAYEFRLPGARIAAAQETHAQACERLGLARCRITGMRYRLDRDNAVSAMLAFKLDPTLARAFGREGIKAIEAAEGMLTDAEITGTDAGAAIERIDAESDAIREARARIDRELARPGLDRTTRAELLRQRGELDTQVRTAGTAKAEQRESLAKTPMTFEYQSGIAVRGFDPASPFTRAADMAVGSFQVTLAILLGALALAGPPALVLGLLYLLWRRLHLRWPLRRRDDKVQSTPPG